MEMNEMENKAEGIVEIPVEKTAAPAEQAAEATTASESTEARTPAAAELINGAKSNPTGTLNIIGILDGILSLILGLVMFSKEIGTWENNVSYGGDAYTGIQNAAAQTANNVQYLSDLVKFGFGSLLIVVGIALISYFGIKYCAEKKK